MPRPARARDLIVLEPGAPDFLTGGWWKAYSEGRLFYPRGFAAAMTPAGLDTVTHLVDFLQPAVALIASQTEWTKQLKDSKNWKNCAPNKLDDAAAERPMILSKAATCMVALELYIAQEGPEGPEGQPIDVFELVKLFPGQTAVTGLLLEVVQELIALRPDELKNFEREARDLFQDQPRDILLHVAENGLHVPYGIALLIQRHFDGYKGMDIQLRRAERPPHRGVSPASPAVRPYFPPPLAADPAVAETPPAAVPEGLSGEET